MSLFFFFFALKSLCIFGARRYTGLDWDGKDWVLHAYASSMGFVTFTRGGFLYTISAFFFLFCSYHLLEYLDPSLDNDTYYGGYYWDTTLQSFPLTNRSIMVNEQLDWLR